MRFFDVAALGSLPALVRESAERALVLVGAVPDEEHREVAREVRRSADRGGAELGELIVRAAAVRHFLG